MFPEFLDNTNRKTMELHLFAMKAFKGFQNARTDHPITAITRSESSAFPAPACAARGGGLRLHSGVFLLAFPGLRAGQDGDVHSGPQQQTSDRRTRRGAWSRQCSFPPSTSRRSPLKS